MTTACRFLQPAIDKASPGDTVLLPASGTEASPTPWRGPVEVHENETGALLSNLTLCGVPAPDDAPADERDVVVHDGPAPCDGPRTHPIIDGTSTDQPTLSVQAPGVQVLNLTLRRTLEPIDNPAFQDPEPLASRPVLHVNASNVRIEDSRLKLNRPDCPTTGLLPAPGGPSCSLPTTGSLAELTARASNTVVEDSVLVGPSTGVTILNGTPQGITLRSNELALSLDPAISLGPGVEDVTVDARYNNWTTIVDRDRVTGLQGAFPSPLPDGEPVRERTPQLDNEERTSQALDSCEAAWTRIHDAGNANYVSYIPPVNATVDAPLEDQSTAIDGCTSSTRNFHPQFDFHPSPSFQDDTLQLEPRADGTVTVNATLYTAAGTPVQERPTLNLGQARLVAQNASGSNLPLVTDFSPVNRDANRLSFQFRTTDLDPVGGITTPLDLWIEVPTLAQSSSQGDRHVFSFYNRAANETFAEATGPAAAQAAAAQADAQDSLPTPVEVTAGPVDHVDIQAPATIDASREPTLQATPEDRFGTPRDDAITWTLTDPTDSGRLTDTRGQDATLVPGQTGPVDVTAAVVEDGEVLASSTATIDVRLGPLHEVALACPTEVPANRTSVNLPATPQDVRGNSRPDPVSFQLDGVGSLESTGDQSATFVPNQTGTATITAVATDEGNETRAGSERTRTASCSFEVTVGPLHDLELTTTQSTVAADERLEVTAKPQDVRGNERDEGVVFTLKNQTGTGSLDPTGSQSTELVPTETGTVEIVATAHDDDNGTDVTRSQNVTIEPGALDEVRIETSSGSEIQDVDASTDAALDLVARGYDVHDNLRGPTAVDWSLAPVQGQDAPERIGDFTAEESTTHTTLDLTTLGEAAVEAQAAGDAAIVDRTGVVNVSVGDLDHLGIRVTEAGNEDPLHQADEDLAPIDVAADTTLELTAIGFDADDNRRGPTPVDWGVDNGTDPCPQDPTSSCTFEPSQAGRSVTFEAFHDPETPKAFSPEISVAPGDLFRIRILDADGEPFGRSDVTTDRELALTAQGLDADNNTLGLKDVNWRLTDEDGDGADVGNLTTTEGNRTVLDLDTPGTAQVVANHSDLPATRDGRTTNVTVTSGKLDHVRVLNRTDEPVGDRTLTADEQLTVSAVGFDADDNRKGATEVSWSTTDSLQDTCPETRTSECTLDPTEADTSGRLVADHPDLDIPDETGTGTITVVPGQLDHVRVAAEDDPTRGTRT